MAWQMPPMSASLGLLLISIGLVVGFDLRFKLDEADDSEE